MDRRTSIKWNWAGAGVLIGGAIGIIVEEYFRVKYMASNMERLLNEAREDDRRKEEREKAITQKISDQRKT